MAKILVADDNSNIQKMVGLALKDQGIDVVAVGNGEAAVRKIADVRPDLVLADVFMPVRNGYEVCQFVKMDSALSHIPVILLVGAFDPLDEQEAQRVGADGVLKKPFIPPDPLISMVKSALQRAGGGHFSAPAAKATEPEALRGTDLLTTGGSDMPTVGATPIEEFPQSSSPAMSESFVDEVPPPARPEPVKIESGSQPVAFGSLLETPREEKEENESFAGGTAPEFEMDHAWRDRDEEEVIEEEEEDEEPAAWRPEGSEEEEVSAAKSKKSKSIASDWRAGGFEQIGKSRSMGWEPEEEKPEPVEAAPVASNRATETPVAPPAAPPAKVQETTPVPTRPFGTGAWGPPAPPATPPATPPAKVQEPTPVSTKPFGTGAWGPAVPPVPVTPTVSQEKPSTQTVTAVVEDKAKTASETKPAPEKKEGKDSWFSVSSSPWEAEIQKANQLASTWDAPTATKEPAAPTNGTKKIAEAEKVSQETKAVIEEAALPPATVEAIREEAAQVAEDATFVLETGDSSSEGSGFYAQDEKDTVEPTSPPPPTASAPTTTAPAAPNMDDLVAKVLAKMNPEMLQAVTREILKPVVEAMVKEELKSKKS